MVSGPFARAMLTAFFFFGSLNGFVLLPLYIHQLGGTEASIGMVQGLYSATGIICQPLVGAWIDRLGRRTFMLLGASILTVATAAFIVTSSIPGLAVLRALHGVAFSAFFVANYLYVVDLVPPERRGWALGIFGLSGLISTSLAPLFGEFLVRHWGFTRLVRVLDPPRRGGDRGRRAHAGRAAPGARRRHHRRRVPRQHARAVATAHGPDVLLRPGHGNDLHVPADVRGSTWACAASASSTPPMRWPPCSCGWSAGSSSTCAVRAR